MSKYLKSLLCACLSLPAGAISANEFDPTDYLTEKYRDSKNLDMDNTGLVISEERLDGIDYIKYQSGPSALYIERAGFTLRDEQDIPVVMDCATPQFGANPVPRVIRHKHHVRFDRKLTDKWKLDATIVNAILYDACGGKVLTYETMTKPMSVGVSWETMGNRQKKIYRIFNEGFGPNLGFDMRF